MNRQLNPERCCSRRTWTAPCPSPTLIPHAPFFFIIIIQLLLLNEQGRIVFYLGRTGERTGEQADRALWVVGGYYPSPTPVLVGVGWTIPTRQTDEWIGWITDPTLQFHALLFNFFGANKGFGLVTRQDRLCGEWQWWALVRH